MTKDQILETVNSQPWYYDNSICDDCEFEGDRNLKYVKRIEDDGICFCKKHWNMYQQAMKFDGYSVEQFEVQ